MQLTSELLFLDTMESNTLLEHADFSGKSLLLGLVDGALLPSGDEISQSEGQQLFGAKKHIGYVRETRLEVGHVSTHAVPDSSCVEGLISPRICLLDGRYSLFELGTVDTTANLKRRKQQREGK